VGFYLYPKDKSPAISNRRQIHDFGLY